MSTMTDCIHDCFNCAEACQHCLIAMLREASDSIGTNDSVCPACCTECADFCMLCARIMSADGNFVPEICGLCADVCEWCSEECDKMGHEHCKKCAEACRACAESCRAVAA